MLYDLHIHSTMSDGKASLKEIDSISKRKFTPGGIADHVSPYHKINSEKTFAKYIKELDKYDLLKGAELCLGAKLDISDKSLEQLDYVIGSVHSVNIEEDLKLFFFDSSVRFPATEIFIQIYTDRLVEFLNTQKMDILGHPTLLPLFLQKESPDNLFSRKQIEMIVNSGVQNDVAFEISSRWQVPGRNFLLECKNQNAKVSIGSDAHSKEMAFNFDYPLIIMEQLGITEEMIFVPKKR